jgi:hypothetical protein
MVLNEDYLEHRGNNCVAVPAVCGQEFEKHHAPLHTPRSCLSFLVFFPFGFYFSSCISASFSSVVGLHLAFFGGLVLTDLVVGGHACKMTKGNNLSLAFAMNVVEELGGS